MQQVFTPPVYQFVPQAPPPQTVVGVLNDIGTEAMNQEVAPGQPPNQEFWLARNEYVGSFNINTTDVAGTTKSVMDVSRMGYTYQDPSAKQTFRACMFRQLLIDSAQFCEPSMEVILWAIKPPTTGGKLRIIYLPEIRTGKVTPDTTLTGYNNGSTVTITPDTYLRNFMWEWDLSKQQVFGLNIKGNIPTAVMPTNEGMEYLYTSGTTRSTLTSFYRGSSHFQTHLGTLIVQVQNRYVPGGIFADNFDVAIFKNLRGTKFYTRTGHRAGNNNYIV